MRNCIHIWELLREELSTMGKCLKQVSPGLYYAQFFTYYAFEQCSKNLPIMLNIMPITTAVMPQFIHNYIIFND